MLGMASGWDYKFFKVLASNDTGQALGKQSGFVVPKSIQQYFPIIPGVVCKDTPSIGIPLTVHLCTERICIGVVKAHYQTQSWGGVKSENRVTSALSGLLGTASAGDILLIQRRLDAGDIYRFELVSKEKYKYTRLLKITGGRRWGVLNNSKVPESFIGELEEALEDEKKRQSSEFSLFDYYPKINLSIVKKIARSQSFRQNVLDQYDNRCAVCGAGFLAPTGISGVDAAHVVPKSEYGTDDVRNGIALCKNHHWAFDVGLFGIDHELKIFVPISISGISQNKSLRALHGKKLRKARNIELQVDQSAIKWHMKNRVKNKII